MANSSAVSAGQKATADHYNNLRDDVIDTSTGHTHDGADSAALDSTALAQIGPVEIPNGDHLLVGHTAQIGFGNLGGSHEVQVLGTGSVDSAIGVMRWSNDASPSLLQLGKSRGTSIGTLGIINDNDIVGVIEFPVDDGVDRASNIGWIRAVVDGTPGANDTPGSLIFATTPSGSAAGTQRLIIDSTGKLLVNDTANTDMTIGLTINQGANDDEILTFKSSDVAHTTTTLTEADSFGNIRKVSPTTGGLRITGYHETTTGLWLMGNGETDNTAKTTSAEGMIMMSAFNSLGSVGADGNLLVLRNNLTGRYIWDAEGSAHADVEWTTYDQYDDLAMLQDVEEELLARENSEQTERRLALEAAGIIGRGSWHRENGRLRAMVNMTKLAMLHHGALLQMGQRLIAVESKLKALPA